MRKVLFSMVGLLVIVAPVLAAEGVSQKELKELMGDSYMIEQDYDRSVKQYREVLARDPKNIKARVSLADVLSWQKQYSESILEYLKVLQVTPDDRDVARKLAEVYVWDKQFDQAEAILKPLLATDPQDVKAKFLHGKALLYSGQTKDAIRIFEELDETSKGPTTASKETA